MFTIFRDIKILHFDIPNPRYISDVIAFSKIWIVRVYVIWILFVSTLEIIRQQFFQLSY
jgi:hypothetical protein